MLAIVRRPVRSRVVNTIKGLNISRSLLVRAASTLVLVGSVLAIAWLVVRTNFVETLYAAWPRIGWAIAIGGLVYFVCVFSLAIAWINGFRVFGSERPELLRGLIIYGQTNLYRYLPSNVMHFVGRQVWVARESVPQSTIALVTVWEAVSQIIVATMLGLAAVWHASITPVHNDSPLARFEWGIVGVAACAGLAVLFWLSGRRSPIGLLTRLRYGSLTTFLYLVFYLVAGIVAHIILNSTADTSVGFAGIVGLWALAWVIGYITPGASAGLGVREGVFVALLTPYSSIEIATIIAVGSRASCIVGDLLFALFAWALRRKSMTVEAPD